MPTVVHDTLPCGIEYGVVPMPDRHVVSFQFRIMAGTVNEPADRLGLARLLEETIDKGTERRSGRELSDAFDALGALRGSGTGRETITFSGTALPESFRPAVELHAEMLRMPTFPKDAFEVNLDLARQELVALEDDAQGLTDMYIDRQAFGPLLGRQSLGDKASLDAITLDDLLTYWKTYIHAGRFIVCVSGPVEAAEVADLLQALFDGFGQGQLEGRTETPVEFDARSAHYTKELEQEHMAICWPGVDVTHDDFPIQQVMLGILSGGMSGRLFTEVREKLGLVYWVSAWHEMPRGSGMIFLGASTKPERCDQTYAALLREVDKLAEHITEDELERAITGIVTPQETRGDGTRAHCQELAGDLFFFGRPVPMDEKVAKVQAVTVDDIHRYLATYPRDRKSVVTLGPRPLCDTAKGGS